MKCVKSQFFTLRTFTMSLMMITEFIGITVPAVVFLTIMLAV